jgi:hypothetical protein
MTLEPLLHDLQALGVRFAADGDDLLVHVPRGAMTPDLRAALVAHKAALLAYLRETEAATLTRRVAAFQIQLAAWQDAGRTGVPLLVLPDAPAPQLGQCLSCGLPIPEEHWRCALCREALAQVFELPPDG